MFLALPGLEQIQLKLNVGDINLPTFLRSRLHYQRNEQRNKQLTRISHCRIPDRRSAISANPPGNFQKDKQRDTACTSRGKFPVTQRPVTRC
ncbi:hypothetical protein [Chimaeribacter coloradensis]|uniref:hypothetical protein n=1 Tax=Chimaeribacter coloradensis TaxID=2060068 RepID=UPI0011AFBCA1|nr:hypothetical protein [Chimaeribacter coloradensis]